MVPYRRMAPYRRIYTLRVRRGGTSARIRSCLSSTCTRVREHSRVLQERTARRTTADRPSSRTVAAVFFFLRRLRMSSACQQQRRSFSIRRHAHRELNGWLWSWAVEHPMWSTQSTFHRYVCKKRPGCMYPRERFVSDYAEKNLIFPIDFEAHRCPGPVIWLFIGGISKRRSVEITDDYLPRRLHKAARVELLG